jgi:glycosyltransferase involved in cell wall biosynthesis
MSSGGTARAGAAAAAWGTIVSLTDRLPPRVRYGYVHRLTRAMLARPLPALAALPDGAPSTADGADGDPGGEAGPEGPVTCVLAADGLDVGGIGTVIEMLARGLGAHGVRAVVVCHGDGPRAARLRAAGIEVHAVSDEEGALAAIRAAAPAVVQSHSAPPFLERAALRSGLPLIPVMHNTEIHYTKARWASFGALMDGGVAGIAVSETVREFHLRHLQGTTPIVVIPNGAPTASIPSAADRHAARAALSRAIGADVADDVVFVCLARYDAQKNIAGLVASFARAAADSPVPVRLVCAGDPSDWVELRRADALRRAGGAADRVHLLGNSDARALLTAADAFVLDSFFEGWPVAATEGMAFGLPLLLADVGGGRELVARDAERSVLIPNASGEASLVSDARVGAARRRSRRQPNDGALRDAVHAIARGVVAARGEGRPGRARADADRGGVGAMLARHAEAIRTAAGAR